MSFAGREQPLEAPWLLHLRLIGGGSYRRIYTPSKSFFPVSRHTHNTHQSLHQQIASTYSATARFAPFCPAGLAGAPWPLERSRWPGSNRHRPQFCFRAALPLSYSGICAAGRNRKSPAAIGKGGRGMDNPVSLLSYCCLFSLCHLAQFFAVICTMIKG